MNRLNYLISHMFLKMRFEIATNWKKPLCPTPGLVMVCSFHGYYAVIANNIEYLISERWPSYFFK